MKLLRPLTYPLPTHPPAPSVTCSSHLMNCWQLSSRVQAAYSREHQIEVGLWTAASRIYTRVHSGNELRLDTQVHGQKLYIKHSAREDTR